MKHLYKENKMKTELLPPDTLTQHLKTRRIELLNLLNIKLKAQKNLPQGHLRIEQKKGARGPQFYHFTNPSDTHGKYIPAANQELARRLAQKDYDYKLIKILRQQISILEKLIDTSENKIINLYEKSCPARQKLITPVTLTNLQYTEAWQNISWVGHPFADDAPEFFTARGEQVRSKSEVIIADTLSRHHIPYRYEFPLELKNRSIYHPDFLCLNVHTRQEFIWEHFGMMDSSEYAESTVKKLKVFSDNDIYPGRNLIITMETAETPLSSRQVENLINEYLNARV